jgi:competence protein ComEA
MRSLIVLLVLLGLASATRPSPRSRPVAGRPAAGQSAAAELLFGRPLRLNSATAADLVALPGIGDTRAAAIVEARAARGGHFADLDELLEIPGIGDKTFARIRPLVTLD